MQQLVVLTKGIKKAQLSSQIENIKDKLEAIFKTYSKIIKNKVDKVDKTKLLEILAKEIIRMGLPAVPTLWEPIATVPELDLKVINLPNRLIFATQRAGEPISGVNADVKSNILSNQDKDSKHSACYILAD